MRSLKLGKNDTDINYARLGIDVLSHLPEDFIRNVWIDGFPFGIHEILDRINEALGLDLVSEEVVDLRFDYLQEAYPLRIVPGKSYAWAESEYLFKIAETVDLATVLTVTSLNGLYPPSA